MSYKPIKTIVFALAVLLTVVPLVLAQGTTGQSSDRPTGTQKPGMSSPGTMPGTSSPSSSMGMQGAHDGITATVAEVDQKDNTLKLRMQDGETVEFKVPQTLASDLQKGDSVQVTIRKAGAHTPGMGGTHQQRQSPGTTTQPRQKQ